jgi:hypothetical protein
MTFLLLHLVLYPYPSIISWFPDLKNLHNYCAPYLHAERAHPPQISGSHPICGVTTEQVTTTPTG